LKEDYLSNLLYNVRMNTKPQSQSMTVQGSLLGVLPAIYALLHAFGIELPEGALEAVLNGVMAICAIASVVMTYIGRMRANTVIQ